MSAEELGLGLATYIGAHFSLVGWSMDTGVPIPPSQPQDLPEMTFMQYMDAIGIGYLKNIFTCEQPLTKVLSLVQVLGLPSGYTVYSSA